MPKKPPSRRKAEKTWTIYAENWDSGKTFILTSPSESPVPVTLLVRAHKATLTLRCKARPLLPESILEDFEFATLVDSDYSGLEVVLQVGGVEVVCRDSYLEVADCLDRAAVSGSELPNRLRNPVTLCD